MFLLCALHFLVRECHAQGGAHSTMRRTRSSLQIWSLSSFFFFSGSWLIMCHVTGVLLLSCCHIPQTHGHLFSFFFGGRGRSMIVTRSFSSLPEVVAWGQRVISWHSCQTLHLTTLFLCIVMLFIIFQISCLSKISLGWQTYQSHFSLRNRPKGLP